MNNAGILQELKDIITGLVEKHGLSQQKILVRVGTLSPKEAIGSPARNDYPILEGKEVMIEAEFQGSYGQAFRNEYSTTDGFVHEVVAVLPPFEEETSFYEGWLVNPKTQQFISTGVMKTNEDGSRSLEYSNETDYTQYSKVIITAEHDLDPAPGEHIIEGTF